VESNDVPTWTAALAEVQIGRGLGFVLFMSKSSAHERDRGVQEVDGQAKELEKKQEEIERLKVSVQLNDFALRYPETTCVPVGNGEETAPDMGA